MQKSMQTSNCPTPSSCPQHGVFEEKLNSNISKVNNLEHEVTKLKEDIQDIKLRQVKDSEKIITLFNTIETISENTKATTASIKQINEKMDTKFEKMDNQIATHIDKVYNKLEEQDEKQSARIEEIGNRKSTVEEIFKDIFKDIIKLAISGGLLYSLLNK